MEEKERELREKMDALHNLELLGLVRVDEKNNRLDIDIEKNMDFLAKYFVNIRMSLEEIGKLDEFKKIYKRKPDDVFVQVITGIILVAMISYKVFQFIPF
ncbi:MAG: hypothetical protein ABWK01_06960 [Infirmifilum sp.]